MMRKALGADFCHVVGVISGILFWTFFLISPRCLTRVLTKYLPKILMAGFWTIPENLKMEIPGSSTNVLQVMGKMVSSEKAF